MVRKTFILTILLLLIVNLLASSQELTLLSIRSQLPLISDRMRNERLDPSRLTGIVPRASTEQIAFFLTQEEERSEVTISINTFRLFSKKADYFDGYRALPWWLRNVQLSLTTPPGGSNDFTLELKWGLYQKSHRWDEYWDKYFPDIHFPEKLEDVTEEWLSEQQQRMLLASSRVDSLLLVEGNDGISFSISGNRIKEEWNLFYITIIGSHRIADWFGTINSSAHFLPADSRGGELAGQLSREIWPGRFKNGSLTCSLAGSILYAEEWDWSTTASVTFPIQEQARFLLAFSVDKEGGRIKSGLSYQFLPGP